MVFYGKIVDEGKAKLTSKAEVQANSSGPRKTTGRKQESVGVAHKTARVYFVHASKK